MGRIEFVNTLRGFAALSVLISHYFGVYWYNPAAVEALIKRPMPAEISPPIYVSYLQFHPLFNWGSFGVALFFIISGFVIPISLSKLNAFSFILSRIIRIFPTYAIGLLIGLGAIAFNLASCGAPWPYPLSHVVIHFIPGIRDVLGTTNIDGIIWTLEIEMKFYLVCACLAPFFKHRSLWVFSAPVVLAIIVLLCSQFWPCGFDSVIGRLLFSAQFIIYMFTGVALYFGYIGVIGKLSSFAIALTLLATFILTWRFHTVGIPLFVAWNYVFAFAFFLVAMCLPWAIPKNRVTDFFANISYPLYVLHGVAGYTLLAILKEAGLTASWALLIVTVSALATAYVVHILIEKPSIQWSKIRPKGKIVIGAPPHISNVYPSP